MKRTVTIPATFISIALGVIIALAGSQGSELYNGVALFAICASVSYLLHWIIFIPSYIYQTEHYFDLTGSISYLSAIGLGFYLNPSTWTLGGLWVFLTMAAGLAAITSNVNIPLGVMAYLGLALWILGFSIEVIADKQKRDFKKQQNKEKEYITTGLWAWSRHPNYFGEITLWAGLTLIALPVLSGWQLVTLISPIFVYVLLTRISGIPMLENRGMKKWGSDPEYIDYLERTPSLLLKKPNK